MLPEVGILSICMALVFAILQTGLPIIGYYKKKSVYYEITHWTAIIQFLCLMIAFSCLAVSFLDNDFSIIYVAKQSSITMPWYYKLAAVWGGHEGSLLLWIIIVSGWTAALTIFARSIPIAFKASILGVLGLMNLGFYLFLLTTSQPFARSFNHIPIDGTDLNPILQDPGLLFHPPMLYMGYVGFAIVFAIAIAGLLHKQINSQWAKWCKPWVMLSWSSLTLGIVLGSWWAYHVLGWGGWWFWDPVENASLLPWLLATALIHVLIVSEKREELLIWSVILSILTYCMSLLGTFLVRSGVLISVHAFATDPSRGVFLLSYLLIVIVISFFLVALRMPGLKQTFKVHFLSRTAMLFFNSLLLIVITSTVLIGTLYPLILDVLNMGKISVGLPYFNRVFVPLSIPLLVLMGIGAHCFWNKTSLQSLWKNLRLPIIFTAIITAVLAIILPTPQSAIVYLGIALGTWVILSTLGKLRQAFNSLTIFCMLVAHIGIGVTTIAISVTTNYSQSLDLMMTVGEQVMLGNKRIAFETIESSKGDNYKAIQGVFKIDNKQTVYPQRRAYQVTRQVISEPGIHAGLFSDVYIVLGGTVDNAWAVRMYYKPMIRWIWLGGILMLLGGLLTLIAIPVTKKKLELHYDSA